MRAMRLLCLIATNIPTVAVLNVLNRLEVIGSHTAPVATEMVQLHPVGDRANKALIDPPMRKVVNTAD